MSGALQTADGWDDVDTEELSRVLERTEKQRAEAQFAALEAQFEAAVDRFEAGDNEQAEQRFQAVSTNAREGDETRPGDGRLARLADAAANAETAHRVALGVDRGSAPLQRLQGTNGVEAAQSRGESDRTGSEPAAQSAVDDGPPAAVPGGPDIGVSYEMLERGASIGSGGNADVSQATVETDGHTRTVALKQPRLQETLGTQVVEAFVREANTWAKLDDHPHIVDVVDWDTEPLPWIAMEYMDAGHLGERVDASHQEQLWIAERVTEAVLHAHRFGVAHHDIKPANVLFKSVEDGWAVPKASDWGLARLMLDETGSVEGLSPQYAAPEQFDAEQYGSPDDRTDIYQVGTLVYELVTGQPPFEGSATAVMQGVLSKEPTPPSEVADVPAELDDILGGALAKEPDERYESILYLRDRLQELFDALDEQQSSSDDGAGNSPAENRSTAGTEDRTTNEGTNKYALAESADADEETEEHALTALAGVDERTAESLAAAGYGSVEHIAAADMKDLREVDNVSMALAARMKAETAELERGRSVSRRVALGSIGLGVVGVGGWGLLQTIESDNDGGTGGNDNDRGNSGDNGGSVTPEEQVDSYLNDNDASRYDDTDSIEDLTSENSVTIEAGDDLQFDPAAVRIDPGTTVTWEWLSDGHSVEQTESGFDFEDASIQNEGDTHQWRFDESGVFLYQCGPHAVQGDHGTIIIER